MLTQLIGHPHPMGDKVLTASAQRPRRDRGLTIGHQRTQPGPVGQQGIGQHARSNGLKKPAEP